MKTELIMPQEVEVFYVLPALRREQAIAMKASGKKQKEIASILHVKESTISQYINQKRASEFKFNSKIRQAVAESASKITDRLSLVVETQKLLRLVKEERTLCEIHTAVSDMPKGCDVCFFRQNEATPSPD